MGKAWIGVGLRAVVEFAASVFFGTETVKGWAEGNPSEWLASFAGWPLYSAFSVLAIGLFILGSFHLYQVSREWQDGRSQKRKRAENNRRDALVETMKESIALYGPEAILSPMERLARLDLNRAELARFDLDAPDNFSDSKTVMFYQRLLPYLQRSIGQAQEMARSLKRQSDADD